MEDHQHHKSATMAHYEYLGSVAPQYRPILERYKLVDIAMKVVGVGSAGTFCAIAPLMASNEDPLFLQIKEAAASMLEPYAGKSGYKNHGERVGVGQRSMQAAGYILLGWRMARLGIATCTPVSCTT